MPNHTHRFRTRAKVMIPLTMLVAMGLLWEIDGYLVRTSPRTPDPKTGHIYLTQIHGIIYLTAAERYLTYLPWALIVAAFYFEAVAGYLFYRKASSKTSQYK